eukprot:3885030-Amphidinium_carterae.2
MPRDVTGRLVQVRHRRFKFSGRDWHAVLESGRFRASITLFTPRAHHLLSPGHWRQLAQLGFPVLPVLVQMLSRDHGLGEQKVNGLSTVRKQLEGVCDDMPSSAYVVETPEIKRQEFDSVMEVLSVLRARPPSDLQVFMHAVTSCLRSGGSHPVGQPSSAVQWSLPLPVPFPDLYVDSSSCDGGPPTTGRRRSRYFKERNFREFVNFVVLAMDWLHFGRPCHGRGAEHVPLSWSSVPQGMARPVLDCLQTWYRSRKVASDCDGVPLLDGGLLCLVVSLASVAGNYGRPVEQDQGVPAIHGSLETST